MSSTSTGTHSTLSRAMPGVARRGQHVGLARRAQQPAHERVLAAAGSDYEDGRQRYSEAMKSSTGMAVSDS